MKQHFIGAVAILSVVFASNAALALHPELGWAYVLVGPLMWLVFFGVAAGLVVLCIRWLRRGRTQQHNHQHGRRRAELENELGTVVQELTEKELGTVIQLADSLVRDRTDD